MMRTITFQHDLETASLTWDYGTYDQEVTCHGVKCTDGGMILSEMVVEAFIFTIMKNYNSFKAVRMIVSDKDLNGKHDIFDVVEWYGRFGFDIDRNHRCDSVMMKRVLNTKYVLTSRDS